MKKINTMVLLGAALLILAAQADAMTVTYSTRPTSSGGFFASPGDYASHWASLEAAMPVAPAGFCGDVTLGAWTGASSQGTCGGPTGGVAFHTEVGFHVGTSGVWNFRIGPDYGLGGELLLDGIVIDFRSYDLWWAGSWGDPSQLLLGSAFLTPGWHVLETFGLEGCCDGPTAGQFQVGTGEWTYFQTTVPEPGTVALLGAGLFLMSVRQFRRQRPRR
jgi:hypothetical protein